MDKHVLVVATISATIKGFLIPHIDYLISKGYKVSIATNLDHSDLEFLSMMKTRDINYYDIEFSRNPFNFRDLLNSIKKMYKLRESNTFTHIYTHTPIASFITRFAFKKSSSKIVYFAHGLHFFKGAPISNWLIFYPLEYLALGWTDVVITINEEDYQRLSNLNKCKIIKLPGVGLNSDFIDRIDTEQTFDELIKITKMGRFINENDFVIISIGELNKNKNQITILKAVNKLVKDGYEQVRYLIVGRGNQKEKLLSYVIDNNLERNVKILGYREDVPELLKLSDVLVSMSFREGLPVNVMEAMYAKKAILASKIRGHVDLIDLQYLISEPNDYERLSEEIEKKTKKPSLALNTGLANREKSEKYLLCNVISIFQSHYKGEKHVS